MSEEIKVGDIIVPGDLVDFRTDSDKIRDEVGIDENRHLQQLRIYYARKRMEDVKELLKELGE